MIEFLQQLINGLSLGAIYALIALGYTMVYGVLRFINFAHGDVFMVGAFAGLYLTQFIAKILEWMQKNPHSVFAPMFIKIFGGESSWTAAFIVLVVAMIACAIFGIIIEKLAYRPLRSQPRLTVLITAIGVSLFLENFGQFAFGVDPQSFPDLIGDHAITIPDWCGPLKDLTVMTSQVLVFAVTVVLLVALTYVVTRTKLGTAMRALSVNPVATALMGVNNDVVISFTFALGSALAGAAGILISIQQPSIDPLMGMQPGIKAFVAAVLGGIGNIPGAALGGVLIGVIETLVVGYGDRINIIGKWLHSIAAFLNQPQHVPGLHTLGSIFEWLAKYGDMLNIPPGYRDAVAFLLLILILLFKPNGLLGRVEREKV